RGIRPLPNLETKFVAANTLVGIARAGQMSLRDPEIDQMEERLRDVRARHFSARTPKTKAKYREQDKELRTRLAALLRRDGFSGDTAALLASWDPYDQNASASFFDREWMFGLRDGFDIIIANPPYVRQEQISELKPYFKATYPETYSGTADLFVYFFHQGLNLLRHGGRLVYITNNKWLRAGYGENLRGFLAAQTVVEQLVDFGHSPIFEGADVFPAIVVLEKPTNGVPTNRQVCVADFPREALGGDALDVYIREHSRAVPQARLSSAAWSLENASIDDLMAKIRQACVPLGEYAGVKPYRGVLTGFNEAFLIDTPTKERLVRDDPRAAEIIKPYLRGQDIKRWSPEWDGLWMIVLKSSENAAWPWRNKPEHQAETIFQQTFPALHAFMKPTEARLRARQDKGHYWWELRSCAYYDAFESPKLMYQEIQFHSVYSRDATGFFSNNKVFFLEKDDLYLLAILNSPLMWWHNWRFLPHMKDEALNPAGFLIEQLPIAPPSDATRAEVEPAVARLIAITQADQQARRELHRWLRDEFGIEKLGQKLDAFEQLSAGAFADEVAKRRPKASAALTAGARQALQRSHSEHAAPIQQRAGEALALERRLADLVNAAYGLTPEEIALLWETAPPRMPVGRG
ncbi:Eco57I restriction-modification methylase domain-containing protein, partial [Oscillochloris sp. ZM17-4]|uniref:Eco57I restriction-modification methylase domain-containing protein n=1 Tax=Oscillochloris sp. ZM17-4 TaxID=2866714 RepID=UPI001C735DD5